jgi:hypothetical protein
LIGKWLEKYERSIRFWILIAVIVYFVYALYFAIYGLQFGLGFFSDHYVYGLVTKDPWWWVVLYYGSEGIGGSVSIVLRVFAGAFAVYAAFLYWRKKDVAMPAIRRNTARALLFEAGFFLALIPSVIAAFAYNLTSQYLFYFDHTPGMLLLFGTAIPCLAIILVVPPLLLKLRSKIQNKEDDAEVAKWSSLTGVAYLFVVFWFNYSMLWVCVMVPYPRTYQQYGFNFIFQPINFLSFALTVFGLFAIASATLILLFPALKKQASRVNLTWFGSILVIFSGYFVFNTLYYFLTGTYNAHPSVWYEVIGPLHNPNLWAITLMVIGVQLIVYGKRKNKG